MARKGITITREKKDNLEKSLLTKANIIIGGKKGKGASLEQISKLFKCKKDLVELELELGICCDKGYLEIKDNRYFITSKGYDFAFPNALETRILTKKGRFYQSYQRNILTKNAVGTRNPNKKSDNKY